MEQKMITIKRSTKTDAKEPTELQTRTILDEVHIVRRSS